MNSEAQTKFFFSLAILAAATFVLVASIWVTTRPAHLKIFGRACPEYPTPTGYCPMGVTLTSDANGCPALACYQPTAE